MNNPESKDPKTKLGSNSSASISTLIQERATEPNAIDVPEISLPKEGRTLKGGHEKVEVSAESGKAGVSIPLIRSPVHNNLSRSLSLSYSSARINSPYDNLWIRSGTTHFKKDPTESVSNAHQRFYVPMVFENSFRAVTTVQYETISFSAGSRNNCGYYLYMRCSQDAMDNKVQVGVLSYRTLSAS